MAKITLKGNPCNTSGELPSIGEKIQDFKLTNRDLETKSQSDFKGKIVFNIFPSIDTPVCATSVKHFNEKATSLENVKVLCISQDLPFAFGRFCGAENIENVETLSAFRDKDFGKRLGVEIVDGPLAGVFARAIIVTNEAGEVTYTELVPEIADEPNYDAALSALE